MRILILSCNTGEGHNSSAKAIKAYMDRCGIECEIRDTLTFAGKKYPIIYQRHITTPSEADCFTAFTESGILSATTLHGGNHLSIMQTDYMQTDYINTSVDTIMMQLWLFISLPQRH